MVGRGRRDTDVLSHLTRVAKCDSKRRDEIPGSSAQTCACTWLAWTVASGLKIAHAKEQRDTRNGPARSSHILRQQHQPHPPVADRQHKRTPVRHGCITSGIRVAFGLDARHGIVALLLREPVRVARPVGEDEYGDGGKGDRHAAFDDE